MKKKTQVNSSLMRRKRIKILSSVLVFFILLMQTGVSSAAAIFLPAQLPTHSVSLNTSLASQTISTSLINETTLEDKKVIQSMTRNAQGELMLNRLVYLEDGSCTVSLINFETKQLVEKHGFDAAGNLFETENSVGEVTGFYREDVTAGHIQYKEDAAGNLTLYNYTFDEQGHIETTIITDPEQGTSIYNADNQLISLIGPNGLQYNYSYFDNGEIATFQTMNSETGELTETATFGYQGTGADRSTFVIIKDLKNNRTTLQTLSEVDGELQPEFSSTYSHGNVSSPKVVRKPNVDGTVDVYHYHPHSGLLEQMDKENSQGVRLESTIYQADKPIKTLYYNASGNTVLRVLYFLYDQYGSLKSILEREGDSKSLPVIARTLFNEVAGEVTPLVQFNYQFDEQNNLVGMNKTQFFFNENNQIVRSETRDGVSSKAPLMEVTSFEDGKPVEAKKINPKTQEIISQFNYQYDADGALRQIETQDQKKQFVEYVTVFSGKAGREKLHHVLSFNEGDFIERNDLVLNSNGILVQSETRYDEDGKSPVRELTQYREEEKASVAEYSVQFDAAGQEELRTIYSLSDKGNFVPQSMILPSGLDWAVLNSKSSVADQGNAFLDVLMLPQKETTITLSEYHDVQGQLSEIEIRAGPIAKLLLFISPFLKHDSIYFPVYSNTGISDLYSKLFNFNNFQTMNFSVYSCHPRNLLSGIHHIIQIYGFLEVDPRQRHSGMTNSMTKRVNQTQRGVI